MLECYLVRHTKPEVASGICYGRLDLDVGEGFVQASDAIATYLQQQNCQQIITSPAKRCFRLAQQIAAQGELTFSPDPAWLEFNFGDWEGKSWQQIGQEQVEAWQRDLLHFSMPNGESLAQFDLRVVKAWQQLVAHRLNQRIALVTHAGVIRSIVAHLLACPIEQSVKIKLEYGSITKLVIDGDYQQLCYLNRVNHLNSVQLIDD
ncbi:alpha-ribazole phosphatase [Motilimonas eburnea]|uniref:alpha-ribazole phosphatase n=1 Tax=Motilimonas eburnea TaxID=1737488 RepID=UPI001E425F33|nr:alpha-ribazole phosphatase [Motilimonas eburnea]MCE2571576.1 alpha-ribazole phosphatase [Motilimonas eburnea]